MLKSTLSAVMSKFRGQKLQMATEFTISSVQARPADAGQRVDATCTLMTPRRDLVHGFQYQWELHDTTAAGTPLVAKMQTSSPNLQLQLDQALAAGHRYRLRVRAISQSTQTQSLKAVYFHSTI